MSVMSEYIKMTQEGITQYMKLVFERKFNKQICDSYIKTYIDKKFKALEKENKIYILIDEYDHFTNGMLQGHAEKFLNILGDTGFVRAFYEVIKEYLGVD